MPLPDPIPSRPLAARGAQSGKVDRRHGKMPADPKPIVGWREWVGLPGLGVRSIKAKVDTGARTSALHAFNIVPFRHDREDWVRFDVHPMQRNDGAITTCRCRAVDYRWVTNSGGGREKRFVVETPIRLGGEEWTIEMTLTDRDQMGFRMLLGRTAVKGHFVVDPDASYLLGRPRRSAIAAKR